MRSDDRVVGDAEVVLVEDRVGVALLGEEALPVLGELRVDGVARDDGVDVREADVVAVEAVCLVDELEAVVAGLDEGDVDALWVLVFLLATWEHFL